MSGAPGRAGPPRARIAWHRVDGVLLLDKPTGITSTAALQRVRRKLAAERGGHTGTLDPLASGLLPLAFGEATKFAQGLLDADKAYRATVRLGERTNSGDAEGEVIERRPVVVTADAVTGMLARFRGPIRQIPPMHSALKRDGVPLYTLARKGETVERSPRDVVIHALEIVAIHLPEIELAVRCSKGTYIRTLAEDLGAALGCGAHLARLSRTAVGPFGLAGARTLASVEGADEATLKGWLLPVDALLDGLPGVVLPEADVRRFMQGQAAGHAPAVVPGDSGASGLVRAYDAAGRFIGLGEPMPDGRMQPRRLVATASQSPATALSMPSVAWPDAG